MGGNKKKRCGDGGGSLPPRHIPAELVWDILSRLPIFALHRFQSVCKAWRAIITSPQFIQTLALHRSNRKPCLGLLFSGPDCEAREFEFYYARLHEITTSEDVITQPPQFVCRYRVPFSDYASSTQVVNGVVCLFSTNHASLLKICTREIVHLPKPPSLGPGSSSNYFLGLDTSNNVYKLLRVSRIGVDNNFGLGLYRDFYEILTITTPISSCEWRRLEYRHNASIYIPQFTNSFWANGTLYWASANMSRLVAFCLDNETFNYYTTNFFSNSMLMKSGQFVGLLRDSSLDGKPSLKFLSLQGFWPVIVETTNTINMPAELCGDHCCDVFPVGNLPNGDTLLANDAVNESFTPIYSYNPNSGNKTSQRFVVGKFPWSVAGMSRMYRASSITCLEEDLTPLLALLGNASDQAFDA